MSQRTIDKIAHHHDNKTHPYEIVCHVFTYKLQFNAKLINIKAQSTE